MSALRSTARPIRASPPPPPFPLPPAPPGLIRRMGALFPLLLHGLPFSDDDDDEDEWEGRRSEWLGGLSYANFSE